VTFARGSRCMIGPGGPDGTAGRLVVVVSEEAPPDSLVEGSDSSAFAVVSFDELPLALAVVEKRHLLRTEERPCIGQSSDCCVLSPCSSCVLLLRQHLRDSLASAAVAGESAQKFVSTWNALREEARRGVKETLRQASEWVATSEPPPPLAQAMAEAASTTDNTSSKRKRSKAKAEGTPGAMPAAASRGETEGANGSQPQTEERAAEQKTT